MTISKRSCEVGTCGTKRHVFKSSPERSLNSTRRAVVGCFLIIHAFILADTVAVQARQQSMGQSLRSDVSFADHLQRGFRVREGLPSGFIYDATQTSDGYIWFATHNGISRFDGFKFKNFTRANSTLPSNDTRVLFEDSGGTLWIATTGGLARQVAGEPETIEAIETCTALSAHAIYEDRGGTIWIGTPEKTWIKSPGSNDFVVADNSPSNVRAFCETDSGQMLYGTQTGLFLGESNTFRRIEHERLTAENDSDYGRSPTGINQLVSGKHGIWVCTNRGLLSFENGGLTVRLSGKIGQRRVADALVTRSGDLYVAAAYGIHRAVNELSPLEQLPIDGNPSCLLEDLEGSLWIGNAGNLGVEYFANNLFRTFLSDQFVNCVFEDAWQNMWFGTRDGLYRKDIDTGQFERYGKQDGLPDKNVRTIASKDGKTLWIGTGKGFAKWNGTNLENANVFPEMSEMFVENSMVDSNGRLWFALLNGKAYRLGPDQLKQLVSLSQGAVRWFCEVHPGEIWVGQSCGLYRICDNNVEEITDPAFAEFTKRHFMSHFVDPDGTLWFGTMTGIGRFKNGRFETFTSADGLAADYIDRLATDDHGNLWCGSRDGCFIVPLQQLDEFSAGKREHFTSRRITMLPFTSSSGRGPKVCFTSTGDLWMSVRRGVIKVSKSEFPVNVVPPKPKIELIELDGEPVSINHAVSFLSGRHRLAFRFGAASFLDPGHVQLKYRLNGYDSDWIIAGKERTAHYTDLGPGEYQFQVTATNEDGVNAVTDSVVHFTVHPRWFETGWFRTIAVLSLIGLSIFTSLIYTRSVRRRNQELQHKINERELAEIKLRRSEERFRDLAESTQAIPWEADAQTQQFTFVGNQAVEMIGYPIEAWLIEDFWIEHLHPEDRLEAVEYRQRAIERRQSHQFEYRMIAGDGSVVWLHDIVHVVIKDGVADKLRGFLVDVTDRRSAEEKANDYWQQLSRLNRAASLGEMATSIAHEVNQPLFAIVGNAQIAQRLLKQDEPDMEEVCAALGEIVGDGNRAASIIDNIRSLVRKERHTTEPLDLNQVALDAIEFITPEVRKRGLVLKTELADSLPAINGNYIELQQAILNLVINGAQAMGNANNGSNELVLQTTAQDGFVELAVKDHGVGIEPDQVDRMFEPFYTTKTQGTGMGLAINRSIIEAHHGRIWATPNSSSGATFRFQLPTVGEIKL